MAVKRRGYNFNPETGDFYDEEFDDFSIMENDFSFGDEGSDDSDLWDDEEF